MHIYKSRFLVRGEVWYDQVPDQTPVDWILYRQRSRPLPGARWTSVYTILLDLAQGPAMLLQQMHDSTAYKIRRARDKDMVNCESLHPVSRETLDGFEETYNRFAATKGLASLDRLFLDQLTKDGVLELSLAKSPEGAPLAYHAYYRNSNRSCLLHTVSLYRTLANSAARNAVGRANRYLFWTDILRHREQGLKVFDFGGWYAGSADQERLEINRFKAGFGGKVVREYNCEQVLTLKGRVVLTAAAAPNWTRDVAAKLRPQPGRRAPAIAHAEAEADPTVSSRVAETPALQGSEMVQ